MALLDFNLEAGMTSSLKRSVSSMENLKSLCQGGMKRVSHCYNLSQMDLSQPEDDVDTDVHIKDEQCAADDDDDMMFDSGFDSGFNIEGDCIASPEAGTQFPGRPALAHATNEGTQTPKAPTLYCKKPQQPTLAGDPQQQKTLAGDSQQPPFSSKPKPALTNRLSHSVLPEYRPNTITGSPQQADLSFLHAPKADSFSSSPPRGVRHSGGLSQLFNDSVHISPS